jgi:hypothetical protein
MRVHIAATLLCLSASSAHAQPRDDEDRTQSQDAHRYLGAHAKLVNSGLAGQSELGFGVALAPTRHLEVEVGGIRHEADGNPFAEDTMRTESWLLHGTVRGRLPIDRYALLAGVGVVTGGHAMSTGGTCTGGGLINLCPGGQDYDNRSFASWDRLWLLRLDIGGELAWGPLVMRTTFGPALPLNEPDVTEGDEPASASVVVADISVGLRLSL